MVVDVAKSVFKSGKKNSAEVKLRALKLLNKAICKSETNPDFLIYAQKKVMARLTIFACFCPKGKSPADLTNLRTRGENIFLSDESDKKSASSFLIVLLDCLERWAKKYAKDHRTGETTIFYKSHQELLSKKISFPI
jgi:hypothetical protein